MNAHRRWVLLTLSDALLLFFSTLGVVSVLTSWRFMMDVERLTTAPFLASFTGLSNLAILIVSLVCLVGRFIYRDRPLPYFFYLLKLVFISLIMITFLVTALYLSPSVGSECYRLYVNGGLFNHLLTPLWALIALLLFEQKRDLRYRHCLYVLIPMGAYAIFYLIRCYTNVDASGNISLHYDIYGLARWGLGVTICFLFLFMGLALGIASLLYLANRIKKGNP